MNRTLPLSLLLALAACSGVEPKHRPAEFRGVSVRVTEIAYDGKYSIPEGEPVGKLDANAIVKVEFDLPPTPDDVEASPEWKALEDALRGLSSLQAAYETLAEEASERPAFATETTAAWQGRLRAFDKEFGKWEKRVVDGVILTEAEYSDLAEMAFDTQANVYGLIAKRLAEKREALHRKARLAVRNTDKYEVVVRAYVHQRGESPRRIHVPGYDNIPSGEFSPIDRTSLLPSPQEAKRLKKEVESAEKVKDMIIEIRTHRKLIQNHFEEFGRKLRKHLLELAKGIQGEIVEWSEGLTDEKLMEIGAIEGTDGAAGRLETVLKALRNDVKDLKTLAQQARALAEKVDEEGLSGTSAELMKTADDASVAGLVTSVTGLITRLKSWPEHLLSVAEDAPVVIAKAADDAMKDLIKKAKSILEGEAEALQNALLPELPKTQAAAQELRDLLTRGSNMLAAAEELDPADPDSIPRPLMQLESAPIDLRRTGIVPGDQFQLNVAFRKEAQEGVPPAIPERTLTYEREAVLTGWNRRFSGDVIFYHAVDGRRSDAFHPNVAVSAEMGYYDRSHPNGFWNWLDLGVGAHAAHLDQDPNQTVEIGAGFNASVLGGLFRVGYGWNLSVKEDDEYFWVGFGLFGLLDRLEDVHAGLFGGSE